MMIRGDWDDVDVAMITTGVIAVVSVIILRKEAIPIVLAVITGILGLARGEKWRKRTAGI